MTRQPEQIERIAVLGSGTIGASWGAWFLARGKRVAFHDPSPDAEAFVRRFIANAWPALEQLGLQPGADKGAWTFHADPAVAVRGVDFVQENAPERLPIKRALYAAIEPAVPEDAILASSTSGITMSELQQVLRMAPRMAIGHPFNPPHLIPLVEVVGGKETAPETIAWCLDFYRSIGKRPIHIRKEAAGHLANRLQAALLREAVSAVESGLASVADVDTAISAGPGLRWALMGPYMTFHLGGGEGGMTHMLEQFRPVFESWWEAMGTPKELTEETCRRIIEGVDEHSKGRPIAELAAERDRRLVALLRLLNEKTTG